MLAGCSAGIILILILYLCTIPYRRTFRKRINRKEHRLIKIYGLSMFIVDRFPKNLINRNSVINNAIKELTVKENIQEEKYLYFVQKLSISIAVITISLFIGLSISMSERIEKSKDIKELKRDSKKIMTYEFVAENEKGQQETIQVDINKKELTPDETYKLFKETEELLVKKVLGTNKSTQKINRPLNLVSSIGDNISVSWNISDDTIIDYDGNISDSVPEQGSIVNLTATMSLNGISADYNFAVNVLPKEENKNLQEQLQKYVDENNKYDGKVKLPKEINGQSLKYYQVLPKAGGWIVFSGVCGAIAVFFLKDQDIKKEVKKRNHQMMIDYPEIVSKILLYYNAGLSLKSGIERIVKDYKEEKQNNKKIFRYAYEELEMSLIKMKSGISEMEAINDYGNRCGLHCYIKLSGIIEQNLKRGSKEVSYALKNELNNAMLERKNAALKEGGEMSTKLLGPMILMLVISIVIVIVPAICTMNL